MSEVSKAVFLSYASQDAAAARSVCEALRTNGVEVWFDADGGLEHGDEWDVKIRRQIKECVLFIPIISANTQAREEGYFRLEWDLAAERARTIASGVPFILPIVIDDTREPDALVPDRFRAVQWMKLRDGVVPPEVTQRFLKLWSHRTGQLKSGGRSSAARGETSGESALRPVPPAARIHRPLRKRVAAAAAMVAMLAGAGWWWSTHSAVSQTSKLPVVSIPATTPAEPTGSASASAEARQLVGKVWNELTRIHLDPPILATAEELARRAAKLDPLNPDVWAAWSQVDSWCGYMQYDASPQRIESARANAEHALRLAPQSFEARLAQAVYLVRAHGEVTLPPNPPQAEALLNELLKEQPNEPRALMTAAILERNLKHYAEARSLFMRLAQNAAFAAAAWAELGYAEDRSGDAKAAEAAADRSIQIQPYATNLTLKLYLAMGRGDLDAAEATLDRIPTDISEEDKVVSIAARIEHWRRDPAAMLKRLEPITREWLHSVDYDGPTALWIGTARQMAGQTDAARFQWELGLKLTERRLVENPSSGALLTWKGIFQALLGQKEESEKTLKLASEMKMGPRDAPPRSLWVHARVLNGQADAVIDRWLTQPQKPDIRAAWFRLDPFYDSLRAQPRFQTLADPLKN